MSNEIKQYNTSTDILMDHQAMQSIQAVAMMMADGKATVPKHLQGSPADCLAVVMQAAQWRMNPFTVAQKTHLVSGNLGYEAQLVNAVIKTSGAITGRFHYEYGGNWPSGSDAWVRCGAVISGESEIQWGEPLYPAAVTTKNSPLWKTNPKQQAAYLAVKYWARIYCPEVILGVYSNDELEQSPERDVTPQHAPQATGNDAIDMVLNDEPAKAIENTFSELSDLIDDLDDITMVKGMSGDIKADYEAGKVDADQSNELLSKLSVKRDELKAAAINSFDFNE